MTPGDPAASAMGKMVPADQMLPDEPLADAEKTLLQKWIAAGATTDGAPAAPPTFLGFKSRTAFPMATGYTSSAPFLGSASRKTRCAPCAGITSSHCGNPGR